MDPAQIEKNRLACGFKLCSIPGGEFLMGAQGKNHREANFDSLASEDEAPVLPRKITPFRLADRPVTVDQYHRFIQATHGEHGAWCHPECPREVIHDHRQKVPARYHFFQPDQPAIGLCFWDAYAFCAWVGGRLPREMEWEFAALGGDPHKSYPWGNGWQENRLCANRDWFLGHPDPADRYPPNGYGLLSMSGNVWEWMGNSFLPYSPKNQFSPFAGTAEVAVRGGCYGSGPIQTRIRYRQKLAPALYHWGQGFRPAFE